MASTLSSSLLLFIFVFITTPIHSVAFYSSQYSTAIDLHENPDLYSDSKASNGGGGGETDDSTKLWCVAKNNADDASLQASLDWACGQGGTDCGPIQQGGPCYNPDDFQSTASYAFNDYFQKNGMTEQSCNFANTAALTSLNPSHGNCKFPTRARVVVNGGSSATGRMEPSGVSDDTSDGDSQILKSKRRRLWWVHASLFIVVMIFAH